MDINPPFGYKEVVPLQKSQKVRLLAPGEVPDFARKLNAIPISYTEFALAARHYPIVFSSGDNGKSFPFIDRAFGTYYMPLGQPARFGIDDPVPESFLGQLCYPFRAARPPTAALDASARMAAT